MILSTLSIILSHNKGDSVPYKLMILLLINQATPFNIFYMGKWVPMKEQDAIWGYWEIYVQKPTIWTCAKAIEWSFNWKFYWKKSGWDTCTSLPPMYLSHPTKTVVVLSKWYPSHLFNKNIESVYLSVLNFWSLFFILGNFLVRLKIKKFFCLILSSARQQMVGKRSVPSNGKSVGKLMFHNNEYLK